MTSLSSKAVIHATRWLATISKTSDFLRSIRPFGIIGFADPFGCFIKINMNLLFYLQLLLREVGSPLGHHSMALMIRRNHLGWRGWLGKTVVVLVALRELSLIIGLRLVVLRTLGSSELVLVFLEPLAGLEALRLALLRVGLHHI